MNHDKLYIFYFIYVNSFYIVFYFKYSTMDSTSHHPFIEIEIPLTGKQWPLFHNGVAAALTAQCDKVAFQYFEDQDFSIYRSCIVKVLL